MRKTLPQQLACIFLITLLAACTRSGSPIGDMLFKQTKNKVYKEVNADSLHAYFEHYLTTSAATFKNPKYLNRFYTKADFEPVLISKFYADSSLFRLIDYLRNADEHGLSAKSYQVEPLYKALVQLTNQKETSTIHQAYEHIVRAELLAAEALTRYGFALEYGMTNPRKVLPRYYIPVDRPDSTSFDRILNAKNLSDYLDSIQPKGNAYRVLQQALAEEDNEAKRITLIANMERLRWKYTVDSTHFVYVNIPAYQLYIIRNGDVSSQMKVVVGKADGHETPMLLSKIHSVQVNPIWNIPSSIAKKEILVQAKADKYYLANHGMDVYRRGVKIVNPDTIDWSVYNEENLPYSFKQQPGNTNSLGLIKFLFKNGSSVYLHDTPAKAGFSRVMRAASHGCVRVEKPLDLAYALFGEGDKYELIKEEMSSDEPTAKTIGLKPQIPVVLDYVTCKVDSSMSLKFYPDVYKLDSVLYRQLK
ncbi:L,D-transpeptidase family protein [Olivibacter sp. CPCC 100613]|uniref:L,D-transpeptidase family protein n=1 Tax=Olivibacter sp. CPCC 100613 TaxID=3079931 RepID=UPI002FF7ED42